MTLIRMLASVVSGNRVWRLSLFRPLLLGGLMLATIPACLGDRCSKIAVTDTELEGRATAAQTGGPLQRTPIRIDTYFGQLDSGYLAAQPDIPPYIDVSAGSGAVLDVVGFDAMPLYTALADLQMDLQQAQGSTLLLDKSFALPLAYGSNGWQNSTGAATATVVPAAVPQPPLLTLQLAITVTPAGSAPIELTALLPIEIDTTTSYKPGPDCPTGD